MILCAIFVCLSASDGIALYVRVEILCVQKYHILLLPCKFVCTRGVRMQIDLFVWIFVGYLQVLS